jgi:hypothetical protein
MENTGSDLAWAQLFQGWPTSDFCKRRGHLRVGN